MPKTSPTPPGNIKFSNYTWQIRAGDTAGNPGPNYYSNSNKNVWVDIQETTENVRIAIRDEGPGLSPQDKDKLFLKFAKLSARPTAGEHSTGLGLSIVKRMVEAMHGTVACESELGQGAAFIVELPSV